MFKTQLCSIEYVKSSIEYVKMHPLSYINKHNFSLFYEGSYCTKIYYLKHVFIFKHRLMSLYDQFRTP